MFFDRDRLMKYWRAAVLKLLQRAHHTGRLKCEMTFDQVEEMLNQQANRWWSIKIQSFRSSEHFLRYAGRYVRRPPIAQRRITYIGKHTVSFWTKDKKSGKRVGVQCTPEEFIDRWAQHIPGRYKHAVRHFGLFAPRAVTQTSAVIFGIIGQKQRPRPRRRRWAESLKMDFGRDPLLDRSGHRMRWVRRLTPQAPG